MKILSSYLFIIILGLSSPLLAMIVEYSVSPNSAVLGETLEIKLVTEKPLMQAISKENLAPFEILKSTQEGGSYRFQIRSYQLGDQQIPTLNVSTEKGELIIPALQFTITETRQDDQIETIIKGIPLQKPWAKWSAYTGIALIFMMLLIVIVRYLFFRKKRLTDQLQTPVQDPAELAIRQLQQIQKNTNDPYAYFFKISQVFRQYIQKTMNIPALEMTRSEIIHSLTTKKTSKENLKRFNHILNYCDTIKFFKMEDMDIQFAITTIIPFIKRLKGAQHDS